MTYLLPFVSLINGMSPYLLLGFFIAGILKVYVPKDKYIKHISRPNFRSILWATFAGIPLPLCSCGVIPMATSLRKEGAGKGAVVSFLISTPQTNVNNFAVSYSVLGLPFALMDILGAFVTGIIGGTLTNKLDKSPDTEVDNCGCCCSASHCDSHSHSHGDSHGNLPVVRGKLQQALHYSFVEMMQDIGKWLLAGIFIAGLIAIFLPEDFFATYLNNPLLNMFIVLAIALPTYTCATSSIPVAAVFIMKGLSPGAALVFLMAGPATSMASMTVIGKSLGKRALLIYLASIISGALLFGLIMDYLLPAQWFSAIKTGGLSNVCGESGIAHGGISWFESACSISLVVLIVNAYIRKIKNKKEAV